MQREKLLLTHPACRCLQQLQLFLLKRRPTERHWKHFPDRCIMYYALTEPASVGDINLHEFVTGLRTDPLQGTASTSEAYGADEGQTSGSTPGFPSSAL